MFPIRCLDDKAGKLESDYGESMIPATCKRLIEVDFPIAAVSAHSAREKSIRHGHPSTLHLWWARRPLAACRSVLLGLLLPDPCDKDCPSDFKTTARELLSKRYGNASASDTELRERLLKFIGEFANWDHAANATYLEIGRGLVKAAYPEETPVVVDPFAGGGSIPLEALRLGCEAFASDLKPVACLILKTLLEDVPRYGTAEFKLADSEGKEIMVHGLANALRYAGKQVKNLAEKELAQFYPLDPDGSRPIAYLWARTVRCEGIGCGAEIPLMRSFWLCQKETRRRALRYQVERSKGKKPEIIFEIFEPKTESEIAGGTVSRANATCPACNVVLPATRVCNQLAAQRGGADVEFDSDGCRVGGAMLLAVVILRVDTMGRFFRLPTTKDYAAVYAAQKSVAKLPKGIVPDEPLPPIGTLGFRVQRYGMLLWGNLFSGRQLLLLVGLLRAARKQCQGHPVLSVLIAQTISHVLDRNTALCRWRPEPYMETVESMYGRQALPMVWDFAEAVSLSDSTGSFEHALEVVSQCVESSTGKLSRHGHVEIADSRESPLTKGTADLWFTDPPYYDSVPYSDLSDFFFVWLKRALPNHPILHDPQDLRNPLTPKLAEIVQDETRAVEGGVKDSAFFEREIGRAFLEGRRVMRDDGVAAVVFAHKTTEGWEALLAGLLRAGLTVTASWPITTEMKNRLRARDSAALAGSVHLVCRPRPADAGVGDWTDVKAAMEKRIREWLPMLVKHGVRGADAIFSCLGPALESYSKFEKVLTASDREVPLGGDPDAIEPEQRGFLAYVFETLSKEALRQVLGDAETEGFEEDSRMTALFLWTLQATKANGNAGKKVETVDDGEDQADDDEDDGKPKKAKAGFSMPFDTFIRITRPMGIHYAALENRVIEIEKGIVRLLL